MSNYEDEHNLNGSNSRTQENNDTTRNIPNQRLHQTLQQALNTFLQQDASDNTYDQLNVQNVFPLPPHMEEMFNSIVNSMNNGMVATNDESIGVDQAFLDSLERVNVKELNDEDTCAICTNDYKNDKYPLVVQLPCNPNHKFDLECIAPWLQFHKTCPLCRVDVTIRQKKDIPVDSEEEEEAWEMYG